MSAKDTSRAAAASVTGAAQQLRNRVHAAIVDAGGAGLTCDELEERLRLKHQTCSARVNELMGEGVIVDSGRKRLTSSKRQAVVWIDRTPVDALALAAYRAVTSR